MIIFNKYNHKNKLFWIDKISRYKGKVSLRALKIYNGINPYIRKLKESFKKNGKIILTDNQINYIVSNYNRDPMLINRVIRISSYIGQELKELKN
jgi:hypothetical protein